MTVSVFENSGSVGIQTIGTAGVSGTFTPGPISAEFGRYSMHIASSSSVVEIGDYVELSSGSGAGSGAPYRVAHGIYANATSNASSTLYGSNIVSNLSSAAGGVPATAAEFNINANSSYDYGDDDSVDASNIYSSTGQPWCTAVNIVPGGNSRVTAALEISSPETVSSYNRGIVVNGYVRLNTFEDNTSSLRILKATGSHTTGIDFSAATFASSYGLLLPNSSVIGSIGGSGGLYTLMSLTSADVMEVGYGVYSIDMGTNTVPGADDAFALGSSGAHWSAVYASTGMIITSDSSLKKDLEDLDDDKVIRIVEKIPVKTWKWIIGGQERTEVEVDGDVPVTRSETVVENNIEIRDGKPVLVRRIKARETQLYSELPVVDEDNNPVMLSGAGVAKGHIVKGFEADRQQFHTVPRTQAGKVKTVVYKNREGKRTHVGWLADTVKMAFDSEGVDYAAFVKGQNGTLHLRPDQMCALLWRYSQIKSTKLDELTLRVAALEAAVLSSA